MSIATCAAFNESTPARAGTTALICSKVLTMMDCAPRSLSGKKKSAPVSARSAAMTAQLVTDALVMAIWRRGKPDALLHHSDRGSQYSSEQFQRVMADNGVVCSMSRSGNVWDNAAMESFFSSLKTERTARKHIGRGMRQEPTCSTTSSASTTRSVVTRRLDI